MEFHTAWQLLESFRPNSRWQERKSTSREKSFVRVPSRCQKDLFHVRPCMVAWIFPKALLWHFMLHNFSASYFYVPHALGFFFFKKSMSVVIFWSLWVHPTLGQISKHVKLLRGDHFTEKSRVFVRMGTAHVVRWISIHDLNTEEELSFSWSTPCNSGAKLPCRFFFYGDQIMSDRIPICAITASITPIVTNKTINFFHNVALVEHNYGFYSQRIYSIQTIQLIHSLKVIYKLHGQIVPPWDV